MVKYKSFICVQVLFLLNFIVFSNFKLKTSKHESFFIWSQILDLILGNQPLEEIKIKEIRKLAKQINKFTINNNDYTINELIKFKQSMKFIFLKIS